MKCLIFLSHRPKIFHRPDDALLPDDETPIKSMFWTMRTMNTPKGGCRDNAAYPLRCLSARG